MVALLCNLLLFQDLPEFIPFARDEPDDEQTAGIVNEEDMKVSKYQP